MTNDERDILETLKAELDFIEQGGYGRNVRTPWQPTSVFQDSLSCLNFGYPYRVHPCSECLLNDFVPTDGRTEVVPCHHIPLNAAGDTIEELELAGEAPPAAMTPPMLRLTCTYTPARGQALRVTVVAGVLIHQQLIELQHDCGTVWDRPGDPDAPQAGMTPADEKTQTRITAVLSAVMQFATAHGWVVRKGIFAP